MASKKSRAMVPSVEQDQISRLLLTWLNQFPHKPVTRINYEFLGDLVPEMALSTIQGAYKTKKYILGGYEAQHQFKVVYRAHPTSDGGRLEMDELLNNFGDWASSQTQMPILGAGLQGLRIEINTRSSLFARYENGDEDHQILMTLTYEVT